jgi:nucleoside-diphosphate-sugar epimerase
VLVTGSAGFIGRRVVGDLLRAGARVHGFDTAADGFADANFVAHRGDLRDREAVRQAFAQAQPVYVLHLGARTDLNESRDLAGYAANIDGVRHVMEGVSATRRVRRWICASSQLVCRVGHVPRSDDDYAPNTLYGESKVETERIVRAGDGGGVEWCLVRPTTIWGPGTSVHYQRFFGMIRDGRYVHIGREPALKSYGYVGNAAAQLMRLLVAPTERVNRRTLYVADYEPITLDAWADEFQRQLGAPPIRRLPVAAAIAAAKVGDLVNMVGFPDFPFNSFRLRNVRAGYRFDLAATEAACGPLPYTTGEGVTETVAWLRRLWSDPRAA